MRISNRHTSIGIPAHRRICPERSRRGGTSADRHIGICTFVVVLFLLLAGCYQRTYVPTRSRDFSIPTTKDRPRPLPQYVVYNLNDSVSRLYFAVRASDLLFQRSNVTNEMLANLKVEYILHPVNDSKAISDSGYVITNNIPQGSSDWIYGYTDMDVPRDHKEYFLDVILRDMNKMSTTYEMLFLSHAGKDAPQNFLLTEPSSETPLYRNTVAKDQQFSVQHNDPAVTKLHVAYYRNVADPARPPYALPADVNTPRPDSTWSIDFNANTVLQFPEEGYYRLTTVAGSDDGLLVSRFNVDYPKVTTPVALLEPLRYITTKKEYATLESSPKMKPSIDSFWIATGGSQERARELISAYYGRVEIVNTHFSTWKEGWKTDRGMVYIIYGEPQNVYRQPNSETWVYGTDQSGNTLNFVFNRNTRSGFPNDYELERNQVYQVSWITAVDYWKQGQVYRAR